MQTLAYAALIAVVLQYAAIPAYAAFHRTATRLDVLPAAPVPTPAMFGASVFIAPLFVPAAFGLYVWLQVTQTASRVSSWWRYRKAARAFRAATDPLTAGSIITLPPTPAAQAQPAGRPVEAEPDALHPGIYDRWTVACTRETLRSAPRGTAGCMSGPPETADAHAHLRVVKGNTHRLPCADEPPLLIRDVGTGHMWRIVASGQGSHYAEPVTL